MASVGIDIGKHHHCAAALDSHSNVVMKPFGFAQTIEGFQSLEKQLEKLGPKSAIRIGMEATGHYYIPLRRYLIRRGWHADAFNPLLSANKARGDVRGRKSDPLDSLCSAEVVHEGKYSPLHDSDVQLMEIKTLTRHRSFMARQLASAKKHLGALADVLHPTLAMHFKTNRYCPTALAVIKAYPDAQALAKAHLCSLKTVIIKASRNRCGRELAIALRRDARGNLACHCDDPGRAIAALSTISQIESLILNIRNIDRKIARRYARLDLNLHTIVGVGITNAAVIVSELGDFQRFAGRRAVHKILAFAGAEPRLRTSGTWTGHVKISKRGCRPLRTALFQSADSARQHDPTFRAIYDRHIAKGKPHKVAVTHVMRKLVGVIYAVRRDNQPFDAAKLRDGCGMGNADGTANNEASSTTTTQ